MCMSYYEDDAEDVSKSNLELELLECLDKLHFYLKRVETEREVELVEELRNHCSRMLMYFDRSRGRNRIYG